MESPQEPKQPKAWFTVSPIPPGVRIFFGDPDVPKEVQQRIRGRLNEEVERLPLSYRHFLEQLGTHSKPEFHIKRTLRDPNHAGCCRHGEGIIELKSGLFDEDTNPAWLHRIVCEEITHYLDREIRFTDSEAWKQGFERDSKSDATRLVLALATMYAARRPLQPNEIVISSKVLPQGTYYKDFSPAAEWLPDVINTKGMLSELQSHKDIVKNFHLGEGRDTESIAAVLNSVEAYYLDGKSHDFVPEEVGGVLRTLMRQHYPLKKADLDALMIEWFPGTHKLTQDFHRDLEVAAFSRAFEDFAYAALDRVGVKRSEYKKEESKLKRWLEEGISHEALELLATKVLPEKVGEAPIGRKALKDLLQMVQATHEIYKLVVKPVSEMGDEGVQVATGQQLIANGGCPTAKVDGVTLQHSAAEMGNYRLAGMFKASAR